MQILSDVYLYTADFSHFLLLLSSHSSLSLKPFFPARPHCIFLSPLWVWPTELTYNGLREVAYSGNWDSGPLCEQCLLLTTDPSLLHQVKCLKCHRDSAVGWFCVYLHTGRLHILCQEPLTCLLPWPKRAPHSAVCLWVHNTMIKREKCLVVDFIIIFFMLAADVFLSCCFS